MIRSPGAWITHLAMVVALWLGSVSGVLAAAPDATPSETPASHSWSDRAELSAVATDGNAESRTIGFKNVFSRSWKASSIELTASGIRTSSTNIDRTAFGDPNSFTVVTSRTRDLTAENYVVKGRTDQEITERFFWYAGAGWDRNRFAGVENRYTAVGGVGNLWRDAPDFKFRTDYALSYTDQQDVVDRVGNDDTFVGVRFSWAYLDRLTSTAVYTNRLVVDENLEETRDLRADMTHSLSVTMSERLALKVSVQLLFDNEPSFEDVDLFDMAGGTRLSTVPVQLDELDTQLSVSLVVNF
ncbi:MAG: DUF481 domain-containing protein [Acidobacteriota bacterium]